MNKRYHMVLPNPAEGEVLTLAQITNILRAMNLEASNEIYEMFDLMEFKGEEVVDGFNLEIDEGSKIDL